MAERLLRKLRSVWVASLLALCVGVGIPLAGAGSARAAESMSLRDMGYPLEWRRTGPEAEGSLAFPLPPGGTGGSRLELALSFPPGLAPSSRLWIAVNDRRAAELNPAEGPRQRVLTLALTSADLADRTLRVSLRARLRAAPPLSGDGGGEVGLHFGIRNVSRLLLVRTPRPVRTVPEFFSARYAELVLVVPDYPSAGEAAAGATAYAILAKALPGCRLELLSASEVRKRPIPRLFVRREEDAPPTLRVEEDGSLRLAASDDAGLLAAARSLEDLSLFPVAPGGLLRPGTEASGEEARKGFLALWGETAGEGGSQVPLDLEVFPGADGPPPATLALRLAGVATPPGEGRLRIDLFAGERLVDSAFLPGGRFDRTFALPADVTLSARLPLRALFLYPGADPGGEGLGHRVELDRSSLALPRGTFPLGRVGFPEFGLYLGRPGALLWDDPSRIGTVRAAARLLALLNGQLPPGRFLRAEFGLAKEGMPPEAAWGVLLTADPIPASLEGGLPVEIRPDRSLIRRAGKEPERFGFDLSRPIVLGQVGRAGEVPLMALRANRDPALLDLAARCLAEEGQWERLKGTVFVLDEAGRIADFDTRPALGPDAGGLGLDPRGRLLLDLYARHRDPLCAVGWGLAGLLALAWLWFLLPRRRRRPRRRSSTGPAA